MREKPCAKRPKGVNGDPKRMTPKAISSQPRRCQTFGGSSGKSNNAGRPSRYERDGIFQSPGRRRPHSVEASHA